MHFYIQKIKATHLNNIIDPKLASLLKIPTHIITYIGREGGWCLQTPLACSTPTLEIKCPQFLNSTKIKKWRHQS